MVAIKFLVVFVLSPVHNLLASCCRQTSRISGNLVCVHSSKPGQEGERVGFVHRREIRRQLLHDVAGVDRSSNPTQRQSLQLWNAVLREGCQTAEKGRRDPTDLISSSVDGLCGGAELFRRGQFVHVLSSRAQGSKGYLSGVKEEQHGSQAGAESSASGTFSYARAPDTHVTKDMS
jgi:hypothetical protein